MCTCDVEEFKDLCCYFADPERPTISDYEHPCPNEAEQERSPQKFESSLITVTPSILTFPYNNPKDHTKRLTLWNRTITALKIRIRSPDPEVFTVYLDGTRYKPSRVGSICQIQLYGLAAKTISIKCTPGRYKIARAPLQLFVYTSRDLCECLQVPLEIYPSTAWFNLPSTIVIPEVVVGRKAHALIILPQPRVSERFFVTFHPTATQDAITLSPMYGTIGGDDGIKQLRVTYAPKEYTTVACSINVHFPGLSTETAHEIKILGRCRPGNESDMIRKEIEEIESFRPKPVKKKKRFPRILIKKRESQLLEKDAKGRKVRIQEPFQPRKSPLSLFTIGGVMRFLLSKVDLDNEYKEEHERRKTAVEILANNIELSTEEKLKIYNDIKKRLGLQDFDQDKPSYQRPIVRAKMKRDWEQFQKAVGLALMGKVEELKSPPPEERSVFQDSRRASRFVRHESLGSGGSAAPAVKISSSASAKPPSTHSHKSPAKRKSTMKKFRKSVSDDEKKMYTSIMADAVQLDLTPKQKFVQLVLIIITRQRAAKRLSKIKVLVEDMKRFARKRSSRASAKASNMGSVKRKSVVQGSKISMMSKIEERKSGVSNREAKRRSSEAQKTT